MTEKLKISSFKIILIFVFFTIIGLTLVAKLPIRLEPSSSLPQINVSFSMSGSSPIVIEKEVTSKLEALLNRMSGIRKINSSSGNGWGNINIQFDKHSNIEFARFEVSTIIRQAWPQLPDNLSYPSISLMATDDDVPKVFLTYTVTAPNSAIEILQFAEQHIKTQIAQIGGVYQVNVSGANPMEWQLEFDTKQLGLLGISISDIQSAINWHIKSESLGLALFDSEANNENYIRISIQSTLNSDTENTLKQIEVKRIDGRIIQLSDIVHIKKIESEPSSYYRINGQSTIYLSVVADANANQLELGSKVKARLATLELDFPDGYKIENTYDATVYIGEEIHKIFFRTSLTIFILLLFVVLVYRNYKYTLLIFISLSMSVAVSIIAYYLLGVEIQLYSMAGLSISLTLIIDNIIVMSDQIIHRANRKAFLAILAATLTTIGSLAIIFFLDEKMRINLTDFAIVIIVNLSVSLFVALFLVPALVDKLGLDKKPRRKSRSKIKYIHFLIRFNKIYAKYISFLSKRKIIVIAVIVLLFGLPVFMMPDSIDSKSKLATAYNKTVGSEFYKEHIKVIVNTAFGGTWRLFVEKVYNGSYYQYKKEETTLFVTASLPNGSTLDQMNYLIQRMETYVQQFEEVRQFETNISSANRASISIRFTKKNQRNSFPHQLKSKLISKSLELGGGSWSVYGVGDGFSNDIKENAGSYRVEMYGYNYDDLLLHAEHFREKLLEYRRIKEVLINSEFSWYKNDYQEFHFDLNNELIAKSGLQPYQLYAAIKPYFERNIYVAQLPAEPYSERIMLQSKQSLNYNIWDLKNIPITLNNQVNKLGHLAEIEKYQMPQNITKENQQYRLCIQYEYIGAYEQGHKVLNKSVEEFQNELPVGYTVKADSQSYSGWDEKANQQYWLLGIVFVIIYFCSAILFNSLKQPFYIIFIVPISFIGIFLSFYWFKLNFDQGGFASFILLSGLTVNINIYIISEFNNIMKYKNRSSLSAYIQAWNVKFRPMLLTVVSTILGFVPFLIGYREGFWFPLAVGTIGGLVISLLGAFLILPVFMNVRKK